MNKYSNLIQISSLPIKIKLKLFSYSSQSYKIKIVGYKKIRRKYNVPIIELSNYIRIWTLLHELE